MALFQTLDPTLRQLHEVAEIAEETKEENIQKFSAELEKITQELIAEVVGIRNQAQDPLILSPLSKPEEVLKYVDDLITKADKKAALASNYVDYQTLFKLPTTKHTELEETRADLNLKRTLWIALQDWQSLTEYEHQGEYLD